MILHSLSVDISIPDVVNIDPLKFLIFIVFKLADLPQVINILLPYLSLISSTLHLSISLHTNPPLYTSFVLI